VIKLFFYHILILVTYTISNIKLMRLNIFMEGFVQMIFLLKKFRYQAGLSQADLALRIGLTQSHISHLEKDIELPSFYTIERVACILCICPYDLIDFCADCNMIDTCARKKFT
jgi:DNA-binding XRE family transcriptional regulator